MADHDNDTIEDLPKDKKGKGGSAWLPVILVVVLLPVLSIALAEVYLFPKMESIAGGAAGGKGEADAPPIILSGGPGAAHLGTGGGAAPASAKTQGRVVQMYHFDTIKTNLSNPSTTLIIVKFSVKGSDPAFIETIGQYQVQLTDATLKVLSLLNRIDTQSPGIQNVVKNDLIARFNQVLGRNLVEDLFFTDFVTQ
jgi:flagellar basal body-associated protein FliL